MLNLDEIVGNKQKQENWPFRVLIIGPSGSGKTNLLLNKKQEINTLKIQLHLSNIQTI